MYSLMGSNTKQQHFNYYFPYPKQLGTNVINFFCFLKTGCNSLHATALACPGTQIYLPLACPPAGIKIMLHHLPTSMVCTNHKFSGGNYNIHKVSDIQKLLLILVAMTLLLT